MALRVRKLAKELETSPEHVLAVLQEIGIHRFRNGEDMLSDVLVEKVRIAWKKGAGRLVDVRPQPSPTKQLQESVKKSLPPQSPRKTPVSLREVLARRGLVVGEEVSALNLLSHAYPEWSEHVMVHEPEAFYERLMSAFCLSSGKIDEPHLQVDLERAEFHPPLDVQGLAKEISNLLMLHGLRRISVVGDRDVVEPLFTHFDPRIEWRVFQNGAQHVEAQAVFSRTDVVVVLNEPSEALLDVSKAVRPLMVVCEGAPVSEFKALLESALSIEFGDDT